MRSYFRCRGCNAQIPATTFTIAKKYGMKCCFICGGGLGQFKYVDKGFTVSGRIRSKIPNLQELPRRHRGGLTPISKTLRQLQDDINEIDFLVYDTFRGENQ